MNIAGGAVLIAAVVFALTGSSTLYGAGAECRDAIDVADAAAGDLASYSRRLQRCAESGDYSNDCSSEFRRVKSAYSDYETASSNVTSECQ